MKGVAIVTVTLNHSPGGIVTRGRGVPPRLKFPIPVSVLGH